MSARSSQLDPTNDKAVKPGGRAYKTSRLAVFNGGLHIRARAASGYKTEIFLRSDLEAIVVKQIYARTFLKYRAKNMSDQTSEATEILDKAIEGFSKSMARFDSLQDGFASKCKRAAGNVRDAAERLANGIERVEKAANFDRLEMYVTLLERAASAMTILADLEAKGKLEKIASAMR